MRRFSLVVCAAVVGVVSVIGYAVSQEPGDLANDPLAYQALNEIALFQQAGPAPAPEVVGRYQFHVGKTDLQGGRSILVDTATGKCWLLTDWTEWKELKSPAGAEIAKVISAEETTTVRAAQ